MWLDDAETPVLEVFRRDGALARQRASTSHLPRQGVAIIVYQRTRRHNVPGAPMTLPTRFMVTGH